MSANLENSAVATGQLSNQSQRKAMPKNVQTTMQLHSSHMLTSNAQNSPSQAQQYMNCELPDVQAGFRKGRGTRDQITNICWAIEKKKRNPERHLLHGLC